MRNLSLALSFLLLAACSAPKPKAAPPAPETLAPVDPGAEVADIGDAEFNISCMVTIAPGDRTPQMTVNEILDYKKSLSMVNADIAAPHPVSLPVTCAVLSKMNFPNTPVALMGRVFREVTPGVREEIGSFSTVAGAQATLLPKRPESSDAIWNFDALIGLAEAPASMLITAELTMLMTPPGTDENAIDPALTNVAAEFTTVEISNPVRINFTPATAGVS